MAAEIRGNLDADQRNILRHPQTPVDQELEDGQRDRRAASSATRALNSALKRLLLRFVIVVLLGTLANPDAPTI